MNLIDGFKFVTSKNKLLFLFFFVIQLLIVLTLLFSYGVYSNSKLGIESLEYEGQLYSPSFISGESANPENVKKLKALLPEILEKYQNTIERCYVSCYVPTELSTKFSSTTFYVSVVKPDKSKAAEVQIVPDEYLSGRYLTNQDEDGEEAVCVVTKNVAENVGDVIDVCGEKMTVVGVDNIDGKGEEPSDSTIFYTNTLLQTFGFENTAILPLKFMPEDTAIFNFFIRFNRVITAQEIEELNDLFGETFGTDIISYPEGVQISYDLVKGYRTLIVAALLLALIAAHCMSSIYLFVLNRKEKETGILIVCGASKYRVSLIFVLEMAVQLIISALAALVIFQCVLRKYLDAKYRWFYYIFYEQKAIVHNLLIIFVAGIVMLTGICIALKVRKTPISIIKNN
jgi:hypothetical protein